MSVNENKVEKTNSLENFKKQADGKEPEKTEKDTSKFDKLKKTNVATKKEDRKPIKKEEPKKSKILSKLAPKKPVVNPTKKAPVNSNAKKPLPNSRSTVDSKNKMLDSQKYERAIKLEAEKNRKLMERVKEFEGEKTRNELSVKCKDIFEEVGIIESARQDLLEVIYNSFSLSNGKLINKKGGRADIAAFLKEYTKTRNHLVHQKRGSGIKNFSENSRINRNSGDSLSSFDDFKNAAISEMKNKRRRK